MTGKWNEAEQKASKPAWHHVEEETKVDISETPRQICAHLAFWNKRDYLVSQNIRCGRSLQLIEYVHCLCIHCTLWQCCLESCKH